MTNQEMLKIRSEALLSLSTCWVQVRQFDATANQNDRDLVTAIQKKMDDIQSLLDILTIR